MIESPVWVIDQSKSKEFKNYILSLIKAHSLIPTIKTDSNGNYESILFTDLDNKSVNSWINYHAFHNLSNEVVKGVADQLFSNNKEYSFRSDIVEKNNNEQDKHSVYFDIHIILDLEHSSSSIVDSICFLEDEFVFSNDTNNYASKWTSQTRFYFHLLTPKYSNPSPDIKDTKLLPEIERMISEKKLRDNLGGVFVYSEDNSEIYKENGYSKIFLSLVSISANKKRLLKTHTFLENRNPIFQANACGVYFENEVYKEKQAFVLAKLISSTLKQSKNPYTNIEKSVEFSSNINLESLDSNIIISGFNNSDNDIFPVLCKQIITEELKGWKKYCFNPTFLFRRYFGDYIQKFKINLINRTSDLIESEYQKYLKKALKHKEENIPFVSRNLEEEVFKVLDRSSFGTVNHCFSVAENLCQRIKTEYVDNVNDTETLKTNQAYKNNENLISGYKSDNLENLKIEKIEEFKNKLLIEITTILKDHPVVFWASMTRVVLITLMLMILSNYTGKPLVSIFNLGLEDYPWIPGLLISFIPIISVFRKQAWRIKRLRLNAERYVALSIEELNQRIKILNAKHIKETRSAVLSYMEWVKEDKLKERLINGISNATFVPRDYAFTTKREVDIPSLQPLFDLPLDTSKQDDLSNTDLKSADFTLTKSKPIFDKSLLNNMMPVVDIKDKKYKLTDLLNDNDVLLDLLPDLYKFEVNVDKVYKDATILKQEPQKYMLILDVSGSMSRKIDFKNEVTSKYDALKNTLLELSETEIELRYIAFSTSAEYVEDLRKLPKPGGVTCLSAAFDQLENRVNEFDKIILVSDGRPTDPEGNSLNNTEILNLQKRAFGFGKPMDVIYIGDKQDDGLVFMENLSKNTGGTFFSEDITSLKTCIQDSFEIFYQVKDQKQALTIRKLLETGNKEACIYGLFQFCIHRIGKNSKTLTEYLNDLMDSQSIEGYKEFIKRADSFADINKQELDKVLFNSSVNGDKIRERITGQTEAQLVLIFNEIHAEYNFIHSILGLRHIEFLNQINLNPDWKISYNS